MKKLLLLVGAIASMHFSASAQIPNNSFENWTGNEPTGWSTPNPYTSLAGVTTASKGTPGSPGNAYLKLESKNVALLGRIVPGAAFSGVVSVNIAAGTINPKSGFAYNQRPQALSGAWQYMAASAKDAGFMGGVLTKWNTVTNKRDTVAVAFKSLSGMAMAWTPFSIPFIYKKSITPDSAMIWMSSSDPTNATVGSYLYVDGLAFVGSVSGVSADHDAVSNLSVYPNPARENLTIEFAATKPEDMTIQLTDIMGRVVKNIYTGPVSGSYRRDLPTTGLSKGIYMLKINSGETTQTKRIVIE